VAGIDIIAPRNNEIAPGFTVRRALPSAIRQAVGPFLFFDHFGPVDIAADQNVDVRPHPHIGLATVTYLFEGSLVHRDSTGIVQRIEPGAVNWMTAGRGIVHSERTPAELRSLPRRSHGLQLWAALPAEHEEDAPQFQHVPADAIAEVDWPGVRIRVLVGNVLGVSSPVRTLSPTVYLDLDIEGGASMTLADVAAERALYSVDSDFELDGKTIPARTMAVVAPGAQPVVRAVEPTRMVMIGGEPLGHRFMVWNFVSSDKERIARAQADWLAQRFEPVPGETEFVPLPAARSR
jgi:redox-sensitive bicupin YhaK (pirin superfamily)